MGKFFKGIPIVVCATFAISLIEALYILPAHLAHQKKSKKQTAIQRWQQAFSLKFKHFVRDIYGPFLDKTLRARYLTVSVGLVVLILTIGYVKSGRLGFEMFPSVESDLGMCKYSLPYGAPVDQTLAVRDKLIAAGNRTVQKVEEEFGKPLLKGSFSQVGGSRRWVVAVAMRQPSPLS